jgi:glycosyltransferase involved in cell wall biosynthesis
VHLLLIHQHFPGQFRDLAPAWLMAGHRITAIGCEVCPDALSRQANFRYWRYNIETADGQPPGAFERGQAVAHVCQQILHHAPPPDVVLAHSGWGEALQLRQAFPSTPLIAYPEIWGTPAALGFGIDPDLDPLLPQLQVAGLLPVLHQTVEQQNLLADLAICQADAAVVPSSSQLQSFPESLQRRLRLIPEGIDLQRLAPNPQAEVRLEDLPPLRPGDPTVTLVSRELEPLRGLRAALRAWPLVRKHHPEARLLLVGGQTGGYGWEQPQGESHLADAFAQLPAPPSELGIHTLGVLPYADMLALLQCSSCHLGLSYPHTLSWSLLEALACATPVVTNHGSPLAAVVDHNRNGLIVPFADSPALAHTIGQLLCDATLRQRLGIAARQLIAERYALDDVLAAYDALFQSLIQRSSPVSSSGQRASQSPWRG